MADKILFGYPHRNGRQNVVVMDHYGPTSYQTGGESLSPGLYDMAGFDMVTLPVPAVTESGNYSLGWTRASGTGGFTLPSVTLQWYVISTGAEVGSGVNLSTEFLRMELRGASNL